MPYRRLCSVLILISGLITGPALADPTFETALQTRQGPVMLHIVQHASFVLRWNERVIYVDPVGGADAYAGLPVPDVVLLTHPHGDHLDADTLDALDTDQATFVMPASVAKATDPSFGAKRIVLANGETSDVIGDGVKAVPMYNLPNTPEAHHPKGWGNGYVLMLADQRLYISGDTEGTPELRGLHDIDLAFLCMNLPYTMAVAQAADATGDFAPDIVYPYHYRGQDIAQYKQQVEAASQDIDVRLRDWYPET